MQIVSLHEMSDPIFWENMKNLSNLLSVESTYACSSLQQTAKTLNACTWQFFFIWLFCLRLFLEHFTCKYCIVFGIMLFFKDI